MTDFAERVFGLANEALAQQERHVSELRTRGSALLAAGALVASLLARAVFGESRPNGFGEIAGAAVGGLAGAALLIFAVLLMRPQKMAFSLDSTETYRALWEAEALEQPTRDLVLAEALDEQCKDNAPTAERLVRYLTFALIALVCEAAGLAFSAAIGS